MAVYEATLLADPTTSQRDQADQLNIPRTTIQHWLSNKEKIDANPAVIDFLESPAGVEFLHQLVLAVQFVVIMLAGGSPRQVSAFLELSGLDRFVAASYGAQRNVAVAMEEAIGVFGQEEHERLSKDMAPKEITVCEDETFHPELCLVAIEPVSNYILAEKYVDNRTAETWTSTLTESISGMPVKVIQSTSDEARGIIHHVQQDFGAHHSPDIFHVQQEVSKGLSGALASQTKKAGNAVTTAQAELQRQQNRKETYEAGDRKPPGRPPHFDRHIASAAAKVDKATQELEQAASRQEQAKVARQDISLSFHPYNLASGAPQDADTVAAGLNTRFDILETVVTDADLSDRCGKRVAKARRVVVNLVATIAFYFLTIRAKVEALELAPKMEEAVYNQLIPGIYLDLVSQKATGAEQSEQLQITSKTLLQPLLNTGSPLAQLSEEDKKVVVKVATECAQLFQRSSSCVEGRNGQLALRHHSLHRLSNRKLTALTTVHNYFIERPDGTTPAERFFGKKPKELFEWLLHRLESPARPALKRKQKETKSCLNRIA